MATAMSIKVEHNYTRTATKSGLYSIHIRVTIDRSPKRYRVNIPTKGVSTSNWQGKEDYWVSNVDPYSFQINGAIKNMKNKIIDLHKRLYDKGRKITHSHISKELDFKGNRTLFNDYYKQYMKTPPPTVVLTPVTWEKYDGFIKMLDKFNPKLSFEEIDVEMAARIRNFMADQPGVKNDKLSSSTVKSYFDKFAVVLRYASEFDDLIEIKTVNAIFNHVQVTVITRKDGLNIEITEMQALKRISTNYPSQDRDRKIFLLECLTGLYYNDLKALERADVRNDHQYGMFIQGRRDKNGNPQIIPMWKFQYGMKILKEFEDPVPNSKLWFDPQIFIEVQSFNRNVKVICKKALISLEVSNKTGRHTAHQMWTRMGVNDPIIKAMVGHEDNSMSANYRRVFIKDIYEATKQVDFEQFGF